MVEPEPLGTGGGIKFAARGIEGPIVVFNGDVLTEIDLKAVIALHHERRAKATIVLTPVENPSAFGLVETDGRQNIQRFIEKPDPTQITTNRINAGIYVLETSTFDRIPDGVSWSIERKYFPSLIERGETFLAFDYQGYWIDIGTPEKYLQVHHDILAGRFRAAPFLDRPAPRACVSPDARISPDATIESPCFIGEGVTVEAGARVAPLSVLGHGARVEADAIVDGAILWPGCVVGPGAAVRRAIAGRDCRLGANTTVGAGAVLGDSTRLTDFTRV